MVAIMSTLPPLSATVPFSASLLPVMAASGPLAATSIAAWGVQAGASLGEFSLAPALPVNIGPTMNAMWTHQCRSIEKKLESTWMQFFDNPFRRSVREGEVVSLLHAARSSGQQRHLASRIYALLQSLGIAPGLVSPRTITPERGQHYPLLWNGLELVLLVRKHARTNEKEAYAIAASPEAGHISNILKILRGYLFNPKEDRTAAGNIAQIISYYENLLSEEELAQFRVFQKFFPT
ncbi:MAG: hypothetical protein HY540_05105 [Deltaproteobacteria bacterium]|nr:hypothetical protein [Deltaproteobacteria bacterium]